MAIPVLARLDEGRDVAVRLQPGLARVGRRARHSHGLHPSHRVTPVAAGADSFTAGRVSRLDGADSVAMNPPTIRKFDAIVVGAGGSGMRAALELARNNLKVAVLSKVFPT